MRIAIINQHPDFTLGGSEIQCDLFAQELAARGHEVYYLAINGHTQSNHPYHVIDMKIKNNEERFANTCIELEPDVVYWRYNKRNFYKVAKKIKNAGIPIVFAIAHINDTKRFSYKMKREKSKLTEIRLMIKQLLDSASNFRGFKYVDAITSNNPAYIGLLPVKKQYVILNSMISEKIPFEWNKPFIVWVANIKAAKNPEMLIEAANHLLELEIDIDILVIGKVQEREYDYFNFPEQLPANMKYLGKKSIQEVNGILAQSMCLVHTCSPEGFPNNFIQSWLQHKPTISLFFDPDGVIERNKIGLYSKNMDQFVDDIAKIVKDYDLRSELGENAFEYAKINHSIERNADNLEKIMKSILIRD